MNNVSQPKVFEFAKEIGMSPLALMDKIREWKLPVRSHMAELEPEVLEQIKTRLKGGGADSEPAPAKRKVAKKATSKAAAPKAAAKKAAPNEAPQAPANKKVAAKKAAPAAPVAEAPALKKGVVLKKAAAKVVIRRKTEEEEQQEQVIEKEEIGDEVEIQTARAVEPEIPAETEVEPEVETPELVPVRTDAPVRVAAVEPAVEAMQPAVVAAAPAAVVAPAATLAPAPTVAAPVEAAPVPSPTPVVIPSGPLAAPTPSRKREVVMTGSGPVSGVKSEAPRRNIVGRMDLSRVQAPPTPGRPQSGPSFGGPSRPGGPTIGGPMAGPRPGGPASGPRPLRTGFVSSAPVAEDEATLEARRKFDERRGKVKAGPGTGPGASTTKEKEEEVQQFSATEFRKREMVFQPKKKKGSLNRVGMQTQLTTPKASKRVVRIDQTMKLSDLANEMGIKAAQLTKALMKNGVTATMNTNLDFDTISLIAPEFNFEALNVHRTVDELLAATAYGDMEAAREIRPPVVTIMGHVDHGKTSLLDAIRKARVAAGEAGGITQHIGAYQVTTDSGHLVTFIDTPGHEAFTAMRARGANATDIAVIVVAADDGVMPQTIEAVSHAKAAGVPIIVAVNKMDKPGANPDRVKQQLTEQQLVPEEWGGETIYVPVSAHTQLGLPELLEQIYLVAEVAELKANPKRSATGVVIESRMDKGRGPVATLLVQDGTLKVGQSIVVGLVPGRVRGLINDKGVRVQEALPSVPVEILGLSEVPLAGDRFDIVEDDKMAEQISQTRRQRAEAANNKGHKISLEDIFAKLKHGDVKELAIILKSDVAGSAEAIKGMMDKLATSEVKIKIVHSAVGGINESDVLLASTAKGIVVGFNVRPDTGAQAAAKRLGVDVKTYTIVYEMIDDLKKALGGLLTPDIVEKQLGHAEVRNTFNVPKLGTIAGCFVTEGKITRNAEIRLVRDGKIVYTGKLASLKRFKDDAKEVAQSFECGIGIENYNDLKVGDIVEAFVKETHVREI
jgi:translation initiation factor IF-2